MEELKKKQKEEKNTKTATKKSVGESGIIE